MHQTKRIELKKGLALTCVTTDQSKTSCLSAMLALPLDAERSLSALLPFVLRNNNQNYPGQQAVAAQLDELYGARLEPVVRKRGETQLIGFVADVIDERYAMQGDAGLFAGTAQLMADLLLKPAAFTKEVINREAAQLCARIAGLQDEKTSWALRRLYQHMCAGEAFRLVELGDIEEVKRITPEQLQKHYDKLMQTAPLELFYCGSLQPEEAAAQLMAAMDRAEIEQPAFPQCFAPPKPLHDAVLEIIEEEPITQGTLVIGLRSGITVHDADYPAMVIFNACFGGTTASRLFRTVREEMSLCYYATSITEKTKGIMAVASGIENASEPKARAEILHQLEDIQTNGLTAAEVEAAKRSVIASLTAIFDNPLSLENFYQTQAAAGLTETLDELIERIRQVTPEQAWAAARKAVPDTVYFLKGAGA